MMPNGMWEVFCIVWSCGALYTVDLRNLGPVYPSSYIKIGIVWDGGTSVDLV
jgi:hypothetical protein